MRILLYLALLSILFTTSCNSIHGIAADIEIAARGVQQGTQPYRHDSIYREADHE